MNFAKQDNGTTLVDAWEQMLERFWSKVDIRSPDECWPWQAGCFQDGYGQFAIKQQGKKGGKRAHRFAFELVFGAIPAPLLACHSCDIRYRVDDISYRKCCNPWHLWLGTNEDNLGDMAAKKRSTLGGRNGAYTHPERLPRGEMNAKSRFTDEQVIEIRRVGAPHHGDRTILARKFGVTVRSISLLLRGETWPHLLTDDTPIYAETIKPRLTAEQVLEIRRLAATGEFTRPDLARRFDTSPGNVSLIVSGKNWKHLL